MLLVVFSIIIISEYIFLTGDKLDAIFIAFWAPTILGLINLLSTENNGFYLTLFHCGSHRFFAVVAFRNPNVSEA